MDKKLRVIITQDLSIAKSALKKYQYISYCIAIKSLLAMIYTALGKYKVKKTSASTIFEEVGHEDYIELQKKKFEHFIFSDEKELRGNKYQKYKRAVNDRFIMKVNRTAHKYKDKIKNKAIRTVLMGTDVLSFFARIGIFIKWEVVGVDHKPKP